MVAVVVVLGIASVLVVSVVQKQREIGILRAMGATRGQVLRVFLLQGAVVGALGSVLGVALAAALIAAFTRFVARQRRAAAVRDRAGAGAGAADGAGRDGRPACWRRWRRRAAPRRSTRRRRSGCEPAPSRWSAPR